MNAVEFEQFITEYEKDLYSFCCCLSGGADGDLYQDTVLAAFEMRARIDFTRNPKSLLFSVAVGKHKNARRKAWRRNAKVPQISLDECAWEEPKTSDSTETIAQSNFEREAIQKALAGLHDKFRIPLILHYFDDMKLEEIAEICKVPKGTIKSRLHKGRSLLKAVLEKEGFEKWTTN
jgi:RNA polymerase sigma-70 factor (ECF subfamily)